MTFIGPLSSVSDAAEPKFVGNDGCKMCHRDEFADWRRSKHGKAFELLKAGKRKVKKKKADLGVDKDYTRSKKCLKCHVTGYRQEGGYTNIVDTPQLVGIGCEMCHGPGSEYRKIHKTKRTDFTRAEVMAAGQTYSSLDAEVCKKCHEHEDTPFQPSVAEKYKFDHVERLKKNARSWHKHYPLLVDH